MGVTAIDETDFFVLSPRYFLTMIEFICTAFSEIEQIANPYDGIYFIFNLSHYFPPSYCYCRADLKVLFVLILELTDYGCVFS